MEKLFFFVTRSDAWKDVSGYHNNFFVDHKAFIYGLLIALVVAALLVVVYYFGCCNDKDSSKMANLPTWSGFLIVSGVLVFLIANFVMIGKSGATDGLFYKHSFYKANVEYYTEQTKTNPSPQRVEQLTQDKDKIATELNRGNDVRLSYSITCAVLSLIFFYILSVLAKRYSRQGLTIPHVWPQKV